MYSQMVWYPPDAYSHVTAALEYGEPRTCLTERIEQDVVDPVFIQKACIKEL